MNMAPALSQGVPAQMWGQAFVYRGLWSLSVQDRVSPSKALFLVHTQGPFLDLGNKGWAGQLASGVK